MNNNWWDGYELTPRKAELKESPGVYKLICKATGQVYVGSGENVGHRIRQHFNRLVKKSHSNVGLQNAWNLYGKDSFDWEIVVELSSDVDQLGRFEQEEQVMRTFTSAALFNTTYPFTGADIE